MGDAELVAAVAQGRRRHLPGAALRVIGGGAATIAGWPGVVATRMYRRWSTEVSSTIELTARTDQRSRESSGRSTCDVALRAVGPTSATST